MRERLTVEFRDKTAARALQQLVHALAVSENTVAHILVRSSVPEFGQLEKAIDAADDIRAALVGDQADALAREREADQELTA